MSKDIHVEQMNGFDGFSDILFQKLGQKSKKFNYFNNAQFLNAQFSLLKQNSYFFLYKDP